MNNHESSQWNSKKEIGKSLYGHNSTNFSEENLNKLDSINLENMRFPMLANITSRDFMLIQHVFEKYGGKLDIFVVL